MSIPIFSLKAAEWLDLGGPGLKSSRDYVRGIGKYLFIRI